MSNEKKVLITPVGNLCFDRGLFEALEDDNGKMNYSCSIVIDAGADITELKKLAMEVATAKFGKELPHGFKWPFKSDKDANVAKYPFLKGKLLLSGKTQFAIGVVDKASKTLTREDIKAGDEVKLALSCYPYSVKGKNGVAFNTNGVLKVAEGAAFFVEKSVGEIYFGLAAPTNETADMFNEEATPKTDSAIDDMDF